MNAASFEIHDNKTMSKTSTQVFRILEKNMNTQFFVSFTSFRDSFCKLKRGLLCEMRVFSRLNQLGFFARFFGIFDTYCVTQRLSFASDLQARTAVSCNVHQHLNGRKWHPFMPTFGERNHPWEKNITSITVRKRIKLQIWYAFQDRQFVQFFLLLSFSLYNSMKLQISYNNLP